MEKHPVHIVTGSISATWEFNHMNVEVAISFGDFDLNIIFPIKKHKTPTTKLRNRYSNSSKKIWTNLGCSTSKWIIPNPCLKFSVNLFEIHLVLAFILKANLLSFPSPHASLSRCLVRLSFPRSDVTEQVADVSIKCSRFRMEPLLTRLHPHLLHVTEHLTDVGGACRQLTAGIPHKSHLALWTQSGDSITCSVIFKKRENIKRQYFNYR